MKDSKEYLNKKAFFDKILTIYGRNSVFEALSDEGIKIYKLHLSNSNRDAKILDDMKTFAKDRGVEVVYHDKVSLSRISKNAKQDQGVALDIEMDYIGEDFFKDKDSYKVIALDGVSNPQNIGMIIRSATAGDIDAIILPTKRKEQISPLVIKSSVGTIFKMPIIKTQNLAQTLKSLQKDGASVYTLEANSPNVYNKESLNLKSIFVLGNESDGVSKEVSSIRDKSLCIPMNRGVESLNVAISGALLSFLD